MSILQHLYVVASNVYRRLNRELNPAKPFYDIWPFSKSFGFDRGQPIDRYFIESFLQSHRQHIRGEGLEFGDPRYLTMFGANLRSTQVMTVDPRVSGAILCDIQNTSQVPHEQFDCIICTQVINCIPLLPAACESLYRMLKPQGVLLLTAPALSPGGDYDTRRWGTEYWRFTHTALEVLFRDLFGSANLSIQPYGNLPLCCFFLQGLSVQDIPPGYLAPSHPAYPLLLGLVAIKT